LGDSPLRRRENHLSIINYSRVLEGERYSSIVGKIGTDSYVALVYWHIFDEKPIFCDEEAPTAPTPHFHWNLHTNNQPHHTMAPSSTWFIRSLLSPLSLSLFLLFHRRSHCCCHTIINDGPSFGGEIGGDTTGSNGVKGEESMGGGTTR
jgi:hypothetical protein